MRSLNTIRRVALATLLLPRIACAQNDWIDTFPGVTEVARAAYEELKVTAAKAKIDMTHDDDSIAVNLAGTFMILRGIAFLKYNEEDNMPPAREEKLRKVLAAYEEAELTIGNGAAKRSGYIKRGPPTGQDCKDMACYRRWFANDILNISGSADYRERILTRLFPCDGLGKTFVALRQSAGVQMPHLPSPAVTMTVEEELAGVGPAGCEVYGGDSDGDGLCDAWEAPPNAPSAVAKAPACGPIELLLVKAASTGGLTVLIAQDGASRGDSVRFRVLRSAQPALDATAQEVWSGEATIGAGASNAVNYRAHIADGAPLTPDATRPYLIVEATSKPAKGPVQCEQPLPDWLDRHRGTEPKGLHGPYANVEGAVNLAGSLALQLTGSAEYGFLVLRARNQPGKYYATAPVRSSQGAVANALHPFIEPEDYYRSFVQSVKPSCTDPTDLELAALVHTHPDVVTAPKNFSMEDFNQAIGFIPLRSPMYFGVGMPIHSAFEKTVMIDAGDRCVRSFVPMKGDQTFTKAELLLGPFPSLLDKYDDYAKRVKKVGCY